MTDNISDFQQLTWDHLISWAGSQILLRGKSYKELVSDLRRINDSTILAWVRGTHQYTTVISMGTSGTLSANCSCPFPGTPCKHSVATVLVFLDMLKSKQVVPMVSKSDKRLKWIEKLSSLEQDDDNRDEDEDEENDTEQYSHEHTVTGKETSLSRRRKFDQSQLIRQKFESMSTDKIIDFVINLVKTYPEIGRQIEEEAELKAGRVTKIVKSIREEVEELASEHPWCNHWSGEGNIPDYSDVRKRLQSLLDAGYADEVIKLGKDLWRLGNEQVESSDDEGETGCRISECMNVVLEAVRQSSLSVRDQILWMIHTSMEDNFGILYHVEESLDKIENVESWSEVADYLMTHLKDIGKSGKKEEYLKEERRIDVMNWAAKALEKSGRKKDIIPLLEREAPITHCYDTLVEHLVEAERRDEAKRVAVKGFRETFKHNSWIAWKLQANLRTIAEQDGDIPLVAAYYSLEFFHHPSLDSYKNLKKALESSRHWPDVRKAAVKFLETGIRPDLDSTTDSCPDGKTCKNNWPLPCPEILSIAGKTMHHQFPANITLLTIAIYEKDCDTIVHRYNLLKNLGFHEGYIHGEVADAVKESHPDLALKIYGKLAQERIARVKPAAYADAAIFLRKMKSVYEIHDRMSEWPTLIQSIRTAHKSKRSLMEILNIMEAKRIVDA